MKSLRSLKEKSVGCDLVKLLGFEVRNYWVGAGLPSVKTGLRSRARVGSNGHNSMLDCEMDELGAAVQIVRIHYLIFVEFDSAG